MIFFLGFVCGLLLGVLLTIVWAAAMCPPDRWRAL